MDRRTDGLVDRYVPTVGEGAKSDLHGSWARTITEEYRRTQGSFPGPR